MVYFCYTVYILLLKAHTIPGDASQNLFLKKSENFQPASHLLIELLYLHLLDYLI